MPVKSEAERRAMEAAAHGEGKLGIPRDVAKEMLAHTPRGKHLPEHVARIAHGMKTAPRRSE